MFAEFVTISGQKPGIIAELLRASYAALLTVDPTWESEPVKRDECDQGVFENPQTVGACLLLTRTSGRIVGFSSWDPQLGPKYGIIGHNCILPEFRGNGLGKAQILEILLRFRKLGVRKARTSTCAHPFFAPAQGMYLSCGFRERRRMPWSQDPGLNLIEYEVAVPMKDSR